MATVLAAQPGTGCGWTLLLALPVEKEAPESVVSAGQGKEKLYSGSKLLSCSAAICSDGTKGKEGYVPVSVMLM